MIRTFYLLIILLLLWYYPVNTSVSLLLMFAIDRLNFGHQHTYDGNGEQKTKSTVELVLINDISRDLLTITDNEQSNIGKLINMSTAEITKYVASVLRSVDNCDGLCRRKIDRINMNIDKLNRL